MHSERIKEKIKELDKIYGLAEKAYKRLQTILEKIDDKVHNEFRYCSRGLKEFICDIESTDDIKIERLQKAIHAAKNAFNDSIDLIVGYATIRISELSQIDTGKELIIYIPNLHEILKSIAQIHREISESRLDIFNRVASYEKILDSEEFNTVVKFCEIFPVLSSNISTDFSREIKSSRRFYITATLTTSTIAIGAIQVIEKAPEFFKFLSEWQFLKDNFPSIQNFISRIF